MKKEGRPVTPTRFTAARACTPRSELANPRPHTSADRVSMTSTQLELSLPAPPVGGMEPFRPVIADSVGSIPARSRQPISSPAPPAPPSARWAGGASSPPSSVDCRARPHTPCSATVSACGACWCCRRGCSAGTCSASCPHAPATCPDEARRERRTHLYRHLRHRRCPALKTMNGFGEWLQLSVFQCRLSRRRWRPGFASSSRRGKITSC